uniref:NADH-ubiquinone oxidoreductase chain 4 n=1 Tax=Paederus fuscipes TaxID=347427 RepID=A0A344H244_9COLE|nr:NADH dehydrogenase subunit 4 [Paederus fuscipes]
MMKLIFMMLFMMPLSFKKNYWLMQYLFILMFLIYFFQFSFNYMVLNISYIFGCDLLSYTMNLLTLWICFLMIMASSKLYNNSYFYQLFIFIMLILLFSLVLAFSSMNLFVFYLFFEFSLIPTLILIIGWGYQPERIQAGTYLLFYTMLASLPMLVALFYYYLNLNSLNFFCLKPINFVMLYFLMNLVFFVKMPMYFVHLWLPKAHVEAPISGSMILAGIMLKLGGYGLMRMMYVFLFTFNNINWIFVVISMVGGVLVSLVCLRQTDVKSLIAYSSVAHMGMVLSGIMTMNYWGMCGSLVMMIAHGLCSSGLFCLSNINYERLMSRSLFLNKGLINLMPSMSLWWFLLSSSNMAAPPSFNLLGEIMLINSLVSWDFYLMIMLSLISFFSAAYSLYLYSYSQHGKNYLGMYSFNLGYIREYLLMMLHWLPLNILIFKSEIFSLWL